MGVNCIPLYFTEEEISFILDMERRSATECGRGVSKEMVLRTLVRLLQQLEVDVSGLKTEDQLLQRLESAIQDN